jgi:small subunit ribosomal protein S5
MNSEQEIPETEEKDSQKLQPQSQNQGQTPFKSKQRRKIRLSKRKYVEKIVEVKRVTKVVKGGKKLSFRCIVVIGNTRGKIGVGVGRADDINLALEKAVLAGKKRFLRVPLTLQSSIPMVTQAKFSASQVILRPASIGTGVIAGGSIRTVLELAGVKNVLAKQLGSKNILNNAKATLQALFQIHEKMEVTKTKSKRQRLFYSRFMKKTKF